ncbi:MAG: AAA family ATPase [Oscillospiraceae bacterium]
MIKEVSEKLKRNIKIRVFGKDEIISKSVITLICGGHLLLDDIPGTAKTTLAKSIAQSIGGKFKRVQFTPDLLPSDITGIYFYNQKTGEFILRKGAIFTNIILADEINRATPRTQSSLLECMEERQVSIDGNTFNLESPFFVIATQNPIENFGTYPLPEAQLDRFLMCLTLGYPERMAEDEILKQYSDRTIPEEISPVVTVDELISAQNEVKNIKISNDVRKYILDLIEVTRTHKDIQLGISTRGAIALMRASQVVASINDRDFVCPEDVSYIFKDVVAHRLILKRNVSIDKNVLLDDILKSVTIPR